MKQKVALLHVYKVAANTTACQFLFAAIIATNKEDIVNMYSCTRVHVCVNVCVITMTMTREITRRFLQVDPR